MGILALWLPPEALTLVIMILSQYLGHHCTYD